MPRLAWTGILIEGLVLAALGGCSLTEDLPQPGNVCPNDLIDLCDVRVEACQSQIQAYVACLAEAPLIPLPLVETTTRTPSSLWVERLQVVRPALGLLGLLQAPTQPERFPVADYDRGQILLRPEGPYEGEEAVVQMAVAQGLALLEQQYGLRAVAEARPGPDGALAVEAAGRGAAVFWGEMLRLALRGESFWNQPYDDARLPDLASEAQSFEAWPRVFGETYGRRLYERAWRASREPSGWLGAPPKITGFFFEAGQLFFRSDNEDPEVPTLERLPLSSDLADYRATAVTAPGNAALSLLQLRGGLTPQLGTAMFRDFALQLEGPQGPAVVWLGSPVTLNFVDVLNIPGVALQIDAPLQAKIVAAEDPSLRARLLASPVLDL